MASIGKMMTTKDGRKYYRIRYQGSHDGPQKSMRWYIPDGWSKRSAEREALKQAALFEERCKQGLVHTREEKKEIDRSAAEAAAAEAAKLKTVRQYGDNVYMAEKLQTFSENARSNYCQILENHIYPIIGDLYITEITTAMLKNLLLDFQGKGYAHSTCIKVYNILNGIFKMAFLDDSIPVNPMMKVERPKPRKEEAIVQESDKRYTTEEAQYIVDCLEKEPLKWQVFILLSLFTGCRRGELCGIKWSDIDFSTGAIQIQRNVQYTPQAGVYETTLKNRKKRIVDVDSATLEKLKQLKSQQADKCISPYVFNQDGTPEKMHPQTPTRYFQKFEKKYNVPHFHPHKLRHTFASIAVTNGADIVSVSQILGHADTSVTLRLYTHADRESTKRAGQLAINAIRNKSPKETEEAN